MIKVESGDELQQAVEAIPAEADIAITPQQEADLRAWLYDFLVAFSASGNDSPRRQILPARRHQSRRHSESKKAT